MVLGHSDIALTYNSLRLLCEHALKLLEWRRGAVDSVYDL